MKSAVHASIPASLRPILVVDLDDVFRAAVAACFQRHGLRVDTCAPTELRTLNDAFLPDRYGFVVLDLCPSGSPHFDLIESTSRHCPQSHIMVLTAYPSVALVVQSIRLGAHDVICKPIAPDELVARLTGQQTPSSSTALLPSLARIESEYIARTLLHTRGNVSASARILGIRRSTLQRKLKKYPPLR